VTSTGKKLYFKQFWNKKGHFLGKKVRFPGVILKYTKKVRFRYLTFIDAPFFIKGKILVFLDQNVSHFFGQDKMHHSFFLSENKVQVMSGLG